MKRLCESSDLHLPRTEILLAVMFSDPRHKPRGSEASSHDLLNRLLPFSLEIRASALWHCAQTRHARQKLSRDGAILMLERPLTMTLLEVAMLGADHSLAAADLRSLGA